MTSGVGPAAGVFAAGLLVALPASALLVVRLERIGERLGLPEASLGLLAALAADAPEITSAATAVARGQRTVGVGVVVGSNLFNLATLLGLGALLAGRIRLRRDVVVLDAAVALTVAGVTGLVLAGVLGVGPGLGLTLAVFVPYALLPTVRRADRRLPLPGRWRAWLVRALTAEEGDLALAIRPRPGRVRDAVVAGLAVAVVVAASVAMEYGATTVGRRLAIPGIVLGGLLLAAVTSLPNAVAGGYLAARGRGAASFSTAVNSNTLNVLLGLFVPAAVHGLGGRSTGTLLTGACYPALTLVCCGLAFARRGLGRSSGALLVAGYLGYLVALVALG